MVKGLSWIGDNDRVSGTVYVVDTFSADPELVTGAGFVFTTDENAAYKFFVDQVSDFGKGTFESCEGPAVVRLIQIDGIEPTPVNNLTAELESGTYGDFDDLPAVVQFIPEGFEKEYDSFVGKRF